MHSPPATRRRAFTLIELLVVVIILGILATLAFPRMRAVLTRSEQEVVDASAAAFGRLVAANGALIGAVSDTPPISAVRTTYPEAPAGLTVRIIGATDVEPGAAGDLAAWEDGADGDPSTDVDNHRLRFTHNGYETVLDLTGGSGTILAAGGAAGGGGPVFTPGFSPTVLGSTADLWVTSPAYPHAAAIPGSSSILIAGGSEDEFLSVDFSTPTAPAEQTVYNSGPPQSPSHVDTISAYGSTYALVTATTGAPDTIYLVDATGGAPLTVIDTFTVGTAMYAAAFIDSTHIAVRYFNGSHMLGVHSWSPAGIGGSVGSTSVTTADVKDIAVSPDTNTVAWSDRSGDRVFFADVSTRTAPVAGGSVNHGALNDVRFIDFADDGTHLLASGYVAGGGLAVIDYSSIAAPVVRGSLAVGGGSGGVAVIDDTYAVWASGFGGGLGTLQVIDWGTDPTSPSVVASVSHGALNTISDVVYSGGDHAYVITQTGVMSTVDLTT